jgi:regulator of replication initiation timing
MEHQQNMILNNLMEIKQQIGTMSANISELKDIFEKHIEEHEKQLEKDDEHREEVTNKIKNLENSQNKIKWMAVGAAGLFASLLKIAFMYFETGPKHP